MSNEQVTRTVETTEHDEENQTSHGNNVVLSIVLFVVVFGLFAGGLYVMSLFTAVTFVVGLGMCLLSLFLTFDLVPRFLT